MENYPCVWCSEHVRPRQEALQCDVCRNWQHRKCNTGITRDFYRRVNRGEEELGEWLCSSCQISAPSNSQENSISNIANSDSSPSENLDSINGTISSSVENQIDTTNGTTNNDNAAGGNNSFDIASRNFTRPSDLHSHEASLEEPPPNSLNDNVTFTIINSGSERGKRKLVESCGYSFTVKRQKPDLTYWWCSVRNNTERCRATVSQKGDTFKRGAFNHCHPPLPGIVNTVTAKVHIKDEAKKDIFKSAGTIVDGVLESAIPVDAPTVSMPKQGSLVRTANRTRQKMRPQEPQNLDFEIDTNFIPSGFLKKDIIGDDGTRHIIFATDEQLKMLAKSYRWYIDGTFKVVRSPFYQLVSIHSFIKHDDAVKQVPLVFCFMSKRRTRDYRKVLRAVKELLPAEPRVEGFVLDFEKATWKAIQEVFPGTAVHGCVFHWCQAVWRKAQSLGLQTAYSNDEGTHALMRQLFALPCLPGDHIEEAFSQLEERATTAELQNLCAYIRATWLEDSLWLPETWSVFMQSVRTNNDCEGWHRRLNFKAGVAKPPFYILLLLLFREAKTVVVQCKLLREEKVQRHQRKSYQKVHTKLFRYWDEYTSGTRSTSSFLRACGKLYSPVCGVESG